ncbi:MAG TPA: hypothetical protein VFP68_23290 [Burkholderiaceae bacterium]|nr:hypothetical protein [Burkholderiaceae bacterium]
MESAAPTGEAASPELLRHCDEVLSRLRDPNVLQGLTDAKFDPDAMAAPFIAIMAAVSALMEDPSTQGMVLARADGLRIAAADALHAAKAIHDDWAPHLRAFAAKCLELRGNELVHAANLEFLDLDLIAKNAHPHFTDLMNQGLTSIGEVATLLNGDPLSEAEPSSQASSSGADEDSLRHLTGLGRRIAKELEERARHAIVLPSDAPKTEADRLRAGILYVQALAATASQCADLVDIALDASRQLANAGIKERSGIATALAERARNAATVYAPIFAALEDSSEDMQALLHRNKATWQQSERIGEEMRQVLRVLSRLFRARQEAIESRNAAGNRDGASQKRAVSAVENAFKRAREACVAEWSRLDDMSASNPQSERGESERTRARGVFGDLEMRIDREKQIALAGIFVSRVDGILERHFNTLETQQKTLTSQLIEKLTRELLLLKPDLSKTKDRVKRMNSGLLLWKRLQTQLKVSPSENYRARWGKAIDSHLDIGLSLLAKLAELEKKIASLEADLMNSQATRTSAAAEPTASSSSGKSSADTGRSAGSSRGGQRRSRRQ